MRFYAAAQTMLLLASRHGRQRAADGKSPIPAAAYALLCYDLALLLLGC